MNNIFTGDSLHTTPIPTQLYFISLYTVATGQHEEHGVFCLVELAQRLREMRGLLFAQNKTAGTSSK